MKSIEHDQVAETHGNGGAVPEVKNTSAFSWAVIVLVAGIAIATGVYLKGETGTKAGAQNRQLLATPVVQNRQRLATPVTEQRQFLTTPTTQSQKNAVAKAIDQKIDLNTAMEPTAAGTSVERETAGQPGQPSHE